MNYKIKVLFVEDESSDRERYSCLLSEAGRISVTSMLPPEDLSELPLNKSLDVVLIDYRLTKKQPSGISVPYRGGTLANFIRERLPQVPLITLSTRDVLASFPNYEEEIQSVDYVLYKSDVNHNPQYWANFLVLLVEGFRKLRDLHPIRWKDIVDLLKANSQEEEDLQRSGLPPAIGGKAWSVHSVFKWVCRTLFRYPGIFYDSLYSSASLGIEKNDFLQEEVQSLFDEALYTGIFADFAGFWWRDRLQEIAFGLIKKWKLPPVQSESFMKAFERETGRKLKPSTCIYSKEKNADAVCCILKKPVKMKYTLGYLLDDRPEVMDPARISFKAIIEKDIDETLIPLADADRFTEIRGNPNAKS